MTIKGPLLTLPILHIDIAEDLIPKIQNLLYLWPGLPQMPTGYWQAPNTPFAPHDAATLLQELSQLSDAALAGVPVSSLISQNTRKKNNDYAEHDDIKSFVANDGVKYTPSKEHLPHKYYLHDAQRFLLWTWLLEERYKEIRTLSEAYTQNAQSLLATLHVENDTALMGLDSIEKTLAKNNAPLPPWKLVIENALPFLPSNATIIINSPEMAMYVREIATFTNLTPADLENAHLDTAQNWQEATICSEKLLQGRNTQTKPWLKKDIHLLICDFLEKKNG